MNDPIRLRIDHLESPLGRIALVVDDQGRLCSVAILDADQDTDAQLRGYLKKRSCTFVSTADPAGITTTLRAYFDGDLSALDRVPVTTAGTPFQESVWRALRAIPCGETWSYGQLARHIGKPAAVRAVGLANGANPVGIVVPCHRVIGSDGSLTGYGGGIERKRWLLAHEQVGGPSAVGLRMRCDNLRTR